MRASRPPLRPLLRLTSAGIAVLVIGAAGACLDISSPVKGIASISQVLSPAPSVVVGDSLRDTTGAARPLRVAVLAANGDTVRDATVRFFALDTSGKLHVDSVTGHAYGTGLSPLARVVAVVTSPTGAGSLHTSNLPLPVVPVPDNVGADSLPHDFTPLPTTADTMDAGLRSPALSVVVKSASGEAVPFYLVSFQISSPLRSRNGDPAVVLTDATGRESRVDTTDAGGHGSRVLRLRLASADAGTETVEVRAHVRYKGAEVTGSPVIFSLVVHK